MSEAQRTTVEPFTPEQIAIMTTFAGGPMYLDFFVGPTGDLCAMTPYLYSWGILEGISNDPTCMYRRRWCYGSFVEAFAARVEWCRDRTDEPAGFIRRAHAYQQEKANWSNKIPVYQLDNQERELQEDDAYLVSGNSIADLELPPEMDPFEQLRVKAHLYRKKLDKERHRDDTRTDYTKGVVVFFEGQAQGWVNELRNPESWRPGCIALCEDGRFFQATGGDEYHGAKGWQALIHTTP